METTATYDAQAGEFIINTPSTLAQKYVSISFIACIIVITQLFIDTYDYSAEMNGMIVYMADSGLRTLLMTRTLRAYFAQMILKGSNEGVHCFLVRIRNNDMSPRPGCTIVDMGPKQGQNGVDNGKLIFENFRIPREALLNAVADVDADGNHVCAIKSKRGRFLVALNQLMSGRLCLASKAVGRTKQALAIAVRYSTTRLAVNKDGESSRRIMDFQLQQNALVPLIARTYVLSGNGMNYVKARYEKETCANGRGTAEMTQELQILCSGIKALVTWHCERAVSVARERCGGAGYLGINLFGEMLNDAHAVCTAEGDNRVLCQKVAKECLAWYRAGKLEKPSDNAASLDSIAGLQHLLHQRLWSSRPLPGSIVRREHQ